MPLTARGLGLLIAAPMLVVAGFRFEYPELTVLGCAAFVALVGALAYAAWRPRPSVRRVAQPDRVVRGEASQITLSVRRASWFGGATLSGWDRCGSIEVPIPPVRLRRGSTSVVDYPVPTERRGVVAIGPLRVTRRDPLGLAELARQHGDSTQVLVYPRSYPLAALPLGVARSLDGRADRVPHGSITFDSLREYVTGDDLRRVHWRTSARVGELMVREHVDTSRPRLVALLDNRSAAFRDAADFESACEAAASVISLALREDLPMRLLLTDAPATERLDHRSQMDSLAAAQLSEADVTVAVRALRQGWLGDTLIVLTGPGASPDIARFGALGSAFPSIMVTIFGDWQGDPAPLPGLLVVSARHGRDFARIWDGAGSW
jgi:uncharacterized protein (DUF58 family)